MNILIKSAKIVDKNSTFNNQTVDILIEDGRISKIGSTLDNPTNLEEIHRDNLHVSPGWMDMRANFCDPGEEFKEDAPFKTVSVKEIPDGWMGLDIGPDSLATFKHELSDCETVVWNGPMGVFEFANFAKGTFGVADALADVTERGGITIIGGGDSVAAVNKAGLNAKMSHISTGGGASLEMLEGKTLPGVASLDDV